jgi:hypothetical protein
MKTIKAYATSIDVELPRLALDAAGIPSIVVGVEAALEGGASGVQVLVPGEYLEAALKVLERRSQS